MSKFFTLKPYGTKPYHAGVAIPVFSLRSRNSAGVGQFSDLKLLADFVKKSAMDVIQLLPVNDTTTFMDWRDSYPYRAISVFALHPIYLDLRGFLPNLTKTQRDEFDKTARKLNALAQIDYEKTLTLKWKFARLIFDKIGVETLASQDYLDFYQKNQSWLKPYAAFCYLRDKSHSADFSQWEAKRYTESCYQTLYQKASAELQLQFFVQFVLHRQLREAVEYCHTLGVAVKGDIAIGIAHDSADAWSNPDLYRMDMQAGAPPDIFSKTGQNWGFPTYNWSKMAKDGYAWWKARMQVMSEYFDAYRLDHILGFFRIWEIPQSSVRGILGHFSPAIGMTAEEIESWGIPFRDWGINRFTKPFIKDWVIDEIFGRDHRDAVIRDFLRYTGDGNYEFKPEFDSQKKLQTATDLEDWLRDGLYHLQENVIFVKDHTAENIYHPRIRCFENSSFREFGDFFKNQLKQLHDDYFYRRNNEFWKEEALKKLPALVEATDMLACGEDLGMVPENVPDVMNQLQILRLIIERMPADDSFVNNIGYAPYLSVVTTSSHDTSPLRAWWQEDRAATQRYYNEIMRWGGEAPLEATPEIIQEIIKRHLNSDAMLTILPLQDWIAMTQDYRTADPLSERINQPEIPFHYWRYRFHIDLEDLAGDAGLTGFFADFIGNTKRATVVKF